MGFIYRAVGMLPSILLLGMAHVYSVADGALGVETITVTDAPLEVSYYADGSCLLKVDTVVQTGVTKIDADMDEAGARMLMHCDTENGRRLTLLARGDSLDIAQRQDLLTREEIGKGSFGVTAWLTRAGVNYKDDSVPRRYVIAGSVMMRKAPASDGNGMVALHSQGRAYATVVGLLEPIVKADGQNDITPLPQPEPQDSLRAQKKPASSG